MQFWARTIVLEDAAEQAADDACLKNNRFEEVFEGLQWLLARTPEIGRRCTIGDHDVLIYVVGADALASTPSIWVVYNYDDDEVTIHNLQCVVLELP